MFSKLKAPLIVIGFAIAGFKLMKKEAEDSGITEKIDIIAEQVDSAIKDGISKIGEKIDSVKKSK